MHEFQEVKKRSNEEGDEEEEEVEKHPGGEVCEEETIFGNIVLVLEPVRQGLLDPPLQHLQFFRGWQRHPVEHHSFLPFVELVVRECHV